MLKARYLWSSTNSPLLQIWVLPSWDDQTYLGVLCLRIIDSSYCLFISLAFHDKRESLHTIEWGASGYQPPPLHSQGSFLKVMRKQRPGRRCKKPPLVVTQSKNRRWELESFLRGLSILQVFITFVIKTFFFLLRIYAVWPLRVCWNKSLTTTKKNPTHIFLGTSWPCVFWPTSRWVRYAYWLGAFLL